MSHQREKVVDGSLILLCVQNPWNTVEVENIGLEESGVLLYLKSVSSQEHRAM